MGARKKKKKPHKRSKKMETQIANKEPSALATDTGEWGQTEISHQDIIIPRILAMQGMSDMVTSGKAKFGDMVENLNEERLGGIDEPFEIVPFKLERMWRITSGDGKELKDMFPIDSNPVSETYNDNMPYEGVDESGEPIRRYRALRFYVMLPKELENGGALPYLIEFKSTSLRAGKKLATQMFTKNRMANLNPAAKTFELSLSKQSNDNGTYSVFDVKVSRDTTDEEMVAAFKWFKALQGGGVKVKEEDSEQG